MIRDPAPEVRAAVVALRDGAVVADELVVVLEAMDLLEPEPTGPPLDTVDAVRFDRQLLYLRQLGTGAELQRRLRPAGVVVVGCGGLGSWAAWSLATIGVGRLVLVDPDSVDATNLNRQLLFEAADVGRSKAALTARRLAAFDPRLEVSALERRVEGPEDVARLAQGASLVVACADTPAYDVARWIDDGCGRGRPAHLRGPDPADRPHRPVRAAGSDAVPALPRGPAAPRQPAGVRARGAAQGRPPARRHARPGLRPHRLAGRARRAPLADRPGAARDVGDRADHGPPHARHRAHAGGPRA